MALTDPPKSPPETIQIEVETSIPIPGAGPIGPLPPGESGAGGVSAPAEAATDTHDADRPGGARLLATDARMAFLLANHARKRAVVRAFGVSEEHANAMTAIALLLLANAAHDRVGRLFRGPPAPTLGDTMLAGGSVRAALGMIVGPAVDETPGLGTLIMLALAAHAMKPLTRRSAHAVRTGSHDLTVHFRHRYGYLVDPGHWRERRAADRSQARG